MGVTTLLGLQSDLSRETKVPTFDLNSSILIGSFCYRVEFCLVYIFKVGGKTSSRPIIWGATSSRPITKECLRAMGNTLLFNTTSL